MDLVKLRPGCSVVDLCEHFEISRIGVMKHLGVLVDAKLIISRKRGRTRELFFNAAAIQMIYDRWTTEYSAFWVTQAVDLKYRAEGQQRTEQAAKNKKSTTRKAKKKPKRDAESKQTRRSTPTPKATRK